MAFSRSQSKGENKLRIGKKNCGVLVFQPTLAVMPFSSLKHPFKEDYRVRN